MPRRRFSRGASPELRLYGLGFFMLLCLCVLLGRLWWEQVARGSQWRARIASHSEVTVRIPSIRGEIRDRNGVTLVGNRASYEMDFYLPDMVRGFKQQLAPHEKMPLTSYTAPVKQMLKEKKEADIVKIVNKMIIPRLQEFDLAKDYNAERLQKHYRNDTEVPFTYLEELNQETIAKFSVHNVGLPGVKIDLRPVRQYIYGALAAHLLGYVGAPLNIDERPDVKDYTFYQADVDGKSQIEASMDKYLRGEPGVRVLQRNVKGVIESEIRNEPPKPGANVYLTLDARIQYICEQALRHPQIGRAAAVVMDPNSGDILGMASVPSFDPNIFIPSVSSKDWEALNKDEAVPLVNRAVSGFPPGSIFKVVTALAGIRKGLGTHRYNCPGGIQYGEHFFKCWIAEKRGSHGMLDLAGALKVSCDCYFYQYGNAASIESIDYVGGLLGIGKRYDLGLSDEKDGVMPGPEWMRLKYPQEKWSPAYTANVTIGQGYVLTSPLQMAAAYVPLANGGVVYEPRLIKKVVQNNGDPVLDEAGKVVMADQPKIRADLRQEFSPQQIEMVRKGLWEVVNEAGGTGGKARLKNIAVAGKTGTAQATDRGKKDTVAWFCSFAPYDKPRYVICTMVQAGRHGGSVAAPIASHIMEQCLAMDQGTYKVELASLAPAKTDHPFTPIEALTDYKNAASVVVASEEEDADSKPASKVGVQMGSNNPNAKPDIRPGADARGKVPQKAPKAESTQAAPDRRSILDRIFGRKPTAPAPPPPSNSRPGPPLSPFNRGGGGR